MILETRSNATQLIAGLALFMDKELRLYDPHLRRNAFTRNQLDRNNQHYWLLRCIANHLFQRGKDANFVLGVAVVKSNGIKLHAFSYHFEQTRSVDRKGALACYNFYASKAFDEEMGDVWILKGTQTNSITRDNL